MGTVRGAAKAVSRDPSDFPVKCISGPFLNGNQKNDESNCSPSSLRSARLCAKRFGISEEADGSANQMTIRVRLSVSRPTNFGQIEEKP